MLMNMSNDFVTEAKHPLIDIGSSGDCFPLALLQRSSQLIEPTEQKIFLVVEICIKCRPADVSAIDDVLHRERFESVLPDQGEKCFTQKLLSALYASIFSLSHSQLLSEHFGTVCTL